jgi:LacI family transcriptional regulator
MQMPMAEPWKIAAYFDPFHLTRQFEILSGVSRYARAKGTLSLGPRPFHSIHILQKGLQSWSGDGVIGFFYEKDVVEETLARGIAVVNLTECLAPFPVPVVVSDSNQIGQIAAKHLFERGYRRFGFIGDAGLIYSQQRREGFVDTLRKARVPANLISTADLSHRDHLTGDWLQNYLGDIDSPIGILASDDDVGTCVLTAAQAIGLRVPQDVAIIGINDLDLICDSAAVPLTSIAPAYLKIGMEAARMMDELLQGKPVQSTVIRLPVAGLVERMSTRFLAFDDPLVERALGYMHANLNQTFNVETVVKHCGKSRRTLEMRFIESVGHSIHDEINRLRIERAKQLLTDTDWTIARIAEECGFSDTKRLLAVFSRSEGKTLRQFRQDE